MAVVHFGFHDLVDVCEVVRGFTVGIWNSDMAFLMPHLEDATNTILALAPLKEILHGPSPDRKG